MHYFISWLGRVKKKKMENILYCWKFRDSSSITLEIPHISMRNISMGSPDFQGVGNPYPAAYLIHILAVYDVDSISAIAFKMLFNIFK
jgi:hypothetical protein